MSGQRVISPGGDSRWPSRARVRDNPEAERQFAEIRLRACIRIGEYRGSWRRRRLSEQPMVQKFDFRTIVNRSQKRWKTLESRLAPHTTTSSSPVAAKNKARKRQRLQTHGQELIISEVRGSFQRPSTRRITTRSGSPGRSAQPSQRPD